MDGKGRWLPAGGLQLPFGHRHNSVVSSISDRNRLNLRIGQDDCWQQLGTTHTPLLVLLTRSTGPVVYHQKFDS